MLFRSNTGGMSSPLAVWFPMITLWIPPIRRTRTCSTSSLIGPLWGVINGNTIKETGYHPFGLVSRKPDFLQSTNKSAESLLFAIVKGGLKLKVRHENLIFSFLNQNICCRYSKEPSQRDGSFEHQKQMLKLIGKKIFTILRWKFLFI